MNLIKEGSVVYCKSGGPKMIVNEIVDDYAICVWLTYRKRYEVGKFHLGGLSFDEIKL